jgi:hypothetical protein
MAADASVSNCVWLFSTYPWFRLTNFDGTGCRAGENGPQGTGALDGRVGVFPGRRRRHGERVYRKLRLSEEEPRVQVKKVWQWPGFWNAKTGMPDCGGLAGQGPDDVMSRVLWFWFLSSFLSQNPPVPESTFELRQTSSR